MLRRASLIAVTLVLLSTGSASAATTTVKMLNTGFVPANLTLTLGDSVRWQNPSTRRHTAVPSYYWAWSAVSVRPGRTSAAVTFTQAGTFRYHCGLHPTRKGTITVPMIVSPSSGSRTTYFTLTLGTVAAPSVQIHDVYVRLNGGAWQLRSSTGQATTAILLPTAGTWDIHSRLRYLLSGMTSDWTPIVTVTVS